MKIAFKSSYVVAVSGLVGVGVALLKEVCHCEWDLRLQTLKTVFLSSYCLWLHVELSEPLQQHVDQNASVPYDDHNGLNL